MRASARRAAKRVLYPLHHRVRNRNTLTVPMFHRVLKRDDPRWDSAVPDWTVSLEVFEGCLRFFTRHYDIVSLDDVLASYTQGRTLPPRSLLITFDDGFADNEEYALPLLRQYAAPAAVFIFSNAVDSPVRLWTEDLLAAYNRGDISRDELVALHRVLYGAESVPPADSGGLLKRVLHRGPRTNEKETELALSLLRKPLDRNGSPAQMLSGVQVRNLLTHGVAIGAHGKTHSALTDVTDLDPELVEPRRILARVLDFQSEQAIRTLAFPYGAYDPRVVEAATRTGYEIFFTTHPAITPLSKGRLTTPLLGRINVHAPTIAAAGHLDIVELGYLFFRAPQACSPLSS
jgi:peptidoglycan/xylan/chitin deacetylase (PgdA/CDA1 family)